MSSRPLLKPEVVIAAGDMTTTLTSKPTIINQLSMISYEVSWSGTAPSGLVTVQASNSFKQNIDGTVAVAGNWSTLTLSTVPAVSGNTGTGFIDIDQLAGYAVRLVYTPTSGSGALTVIVSGKVA